MSEAAIAQNRFGLGVRPGDGVDGDPRRWLTAQFDRFEPRPAAIGAAPTSAQAAADLADYRAARQRVRAERPAAADGAAPGRRRAAAMPGSSARADDGAADAAEQALRMMRRQGRDNYTGSVGARMNAALGSATPFVERLVHFWANHFAVSANGQQVLGFAGPFEFEAIRPHVLGNFRDMLFAVERHPAMLFYLDQVNSAGPNSMLARNARSRAERTGNAQRRAPGLNENLAREIMELHTLGVRTGYDQADVAEFARALTGWTVAGFGRGGAGRRMDGDGQPGSFAFAPRLHEPGTRTVMGTRFDGAGVDQATGVLDMLAKHPATARHVATKLVRHFVADDPPAAVVARCEAAFGKSGGDLPTVYRALIDSPEAWRPAPAKFKTPWDWSVSTLRGLGVREFGPQAAGLLQQLGQPVWRPGSPAGWDDIAASWAAPDAVMRRVEAAERFANRSGQQIDARERAALLLPGTLGAATRQSIARAESAAQGVALLLVSPEFLRR